VRNDLKPAVFGNDRRKDGYAQGEEMGDVEFLRGRMVRRG
jgi:hypothetical protein